MKPISLSEQMMFSTIRLESPDGSTGTGFFNHFVYGDTIVPVIITNKHVVNGNPNAIMRFNLHLCEDKNGEVALDESFAVSFCTNWVFHSSQDLCFTFVNPLFEEVHRRTGKYVFYRALDDSLIYEQEKLEELSALEQVVMVGYPNGLWDQIHNYPLFRRGYTASHPAFDFNRKSIGVVDMACFPGSSGSPILILDEMGYLDKKSKNINMQTRAIFLGVLFEGPQMLDVGEIVNVDVKMQQKTVSIGKTMINLGYYIKSAELLEFKNYIANAIS